MSATASKAPPRPSASAKSASGGGVLPRLLKLAVAIVLLPICWGMSLGIFDVFHAVWSSGERLESRQLLTWFSYGGAAFFVSALLLWRPVIVYVFAHEFVHALATWMFLGQVSNFRASAGGGSVTSSKTNTLIRLAPYFVPLYALLAAAIYLALDHWWRPLHAQLHWAIFALGFFYAFHLGFTVWSLRRDQPDLKPDGWFFSLVAIYLANLAVFALVLGFVSTGQAQYAWPALRTASVKGWQHSLDTYRLIAGTFHGVYARYASIR